MKVKELIENLQECDPEATIKALVAAEDDVEIEMDIDDVDQVEDGVAYIYVF